MAEVAQQAAVTSLLFLASGGLNARSETPRSQIARGLVAKFRERCPSTWGSACDCGMHRSAESER